MKFVCKDSKEVKPVVVNVTIDKDGDTALFYNNIRVGWFNEGDLQLFSLTDSEVHELEDQGVTIVDGDKISVVY